MRSNIRSYYQVEETKRNYTLLIGLIFIFFILITLNQFIFYNSIRDYQNYEDSQDVKTPINLKSALNSPNARPLLGCQYATITQSFFFQPLPSNISFTLGKKWISKNATIMFEGVNHEQNYVKNGNFAEENQTTGGPADWEFKTSSGTNFEDEYDQDGFVEIIIKNKQFDDQDYGYYEQSFAIAEAFAQGKLLEFSTEYYYDSTQNPTPQENPKLYLAVRVNNIEKNYTLAFNELVEDEWTGMSLIYNPISENQKVPDNVFVRVGVIVDENISFGSDQYIRFDNVECNIWTGINQSNIISVLDNEFDTNYGYINTSFGKGYTFTDVERNRTETSEVIFTISKNNTYPDDIEIQNITIISEALKFFNTTEAGEEGSIYFADEKISWNTEFSVSIPSSYTKNWAEIEKPSDWNFTSILDGYNEEKLEECSGTDIGSDKIVIPSSIFQGGLWKLEAVSENYIKSGNIAVWNGTQFKEESNLTVGDKFQINITLDESVNPDDTLMNCIIFYPNDTIHSNNSKITADYNVKFGDFTVTENMTVGTYDVEIRWSNNQSHLYRDKAGYIELGFSVSHHTNLTAITSYTELKKGEPFLLKVKFWDIDTGESISLASVEYNSSYGTSGGMTYQGLGVYFAEINTSSLNETDYYFSFSAKKDYYESQFKNDIIQLRIIYQSLKLEVPKSTITAFGNSYFSCQINVTGLDTGVLLDGPANLSTDWDNSPNITTNGEGTFSLNFSTVNYPKLGGIETYAIEIFANKTGYGATSEFIYVTVHPIQTSMNVKINDASIDQDTSIEIYFKEKIEINCSVYDLGANKYISNGNVKFISEYFEKNFTDSHQSSFSVPILINPSNFNPGLNFIQIVFQKEGYEDNVFEFQINVKRLGFKTEPVNFETSISTEIGNNPLIQIQILDSADNPVENATVFYSWDYGIGQMTEVSNGTYQATIDIPSDLTGSFEIKISVSKNEFYEISEFSYILVISKLNPSNFLFWVTIISLMILVGVASILLLRSYWFLPRKQAKEKQFQDKIQPFKDARNIIGINLVHKGSGLNIYSEKFDHLKEVDESLFSAFIQAIMSFGKEVGKEKGKSKEEIIDGKIKVIELDFKYFYILLCDYEDLRLFLILRDKASDILKKNLKKAIKSIYSELSHLLMDFDGSLKEYRRIVPPLLNKYLMIFYKGNFKITDERKYYNKMKQTQLLSSMEIRVLNIIESILNNKEKFEFNDVLNLISEKDEDLVIEAFISISYKKLIVPVD